MGVEPGVSGSAVSVCNGVGVVTSSTAVSDFCVGVGGGGGVS